MATVTSLIHETVCTQVRTRGVFEVGNYRQVANKEKTK